MSEDAAAGGRDGGSASGGSGAKWLSDIVATVGVHSQFVLSGNVRDLHMVDLDGRTVQVDTVNAVAHSLRSRGTEVVIVHDPVSGLDVWGGGGDSNRELASQITQLPMQNGPVPVTLPALGEVVRRVAECAARRCALIVPFASRLAADPAGMSEAEHEFFVLTERMARSAVPYAGPSGTASHNPIVWMVSREQDFPHWVTADNDHIRTIVVPQPDFEQRTTMARFAMRVLHIGEEESDREAAALSVASATDGMSLRSVRDCIRLVPGLSIPLADIDDAVRCYRVGVSDNPWRRGYLRQRIAEGERAVPERVLGQQPAITSVFDILKRSVMGLTGAHTSGHGGRPRGILFFAGPTGVGKTEMAKAVTSIVFGDDDAYLRFDMSEYSAEQSEARLIGAPPGFVGYDAGGQLTNAVRRKPFSLLLFDEIDKANPRILDKFLQILEDGRLTDGRGGTVHFSETIIIFTSNLGIYEENSDGVKVPIVDESTPYEEMARRVRGAITDHFVSRLGRPELLNRIGDNVVVFSFITEEVARQIFDLQIGNLVRRIREEHGCELSFAPDVLDTIRRHCIADRSLGGRGIGNQVESLVVNPLGRELFDLDRPPANSTVVAWSLSDGVAEMALG